MLCLDEGTPVIMAMCLLGSVLFIVGGSFWGSGNLSRDSAKEVAGIVLFSCSLLFLMLAGLGCWCNRFFCTPDRKSRMALRMYGARPTMPTAADDEEASNAGGSTVRDSDWEEYAGSSSTYRSFRSGRNSTRKLRSRTSLRGDRVAPSPQESQQIQQLLPLPPNPFITYLNSSSGNNNESSSGGRIPVPVEYAELSPPHNYSQDGNSNANHQGYQSQQLHADQHNQRDQLMHQPTIQQPYVQRQPTTTHGAPLTVRPHVSLATYHNGAVGFQSPQSSAGGVQVSDPVFV